MALLKLVVAVVVMVGMMLTAAAVAHALAAAVNQKASIPLLLHYLAIPQLRAAAEAQVIISAFPFGQLLF